MVHNIKLIVFVLIFKRKKKSMSLVCIVVIRKETLMHAFCEQLIKSDDNFSARLLMVIYL